MEISPSPETLLQAAKQAELGALKQLQINCNLVTLTTRLIHEMQRERALSVTFLVSRGQRFTDQREQAILGCDTAKQEFCSTLLQLPTDTASPNAVRLLNSLAFVLQELNELPSVRADISNGSIEATTTTRFYNRIIAGLLTIAFETTDISTDEDINSDLIALFNFMQGKEYAGQERAWGLIGFAAGAFSQAIKSRIARLRQAQQSCFEIFEQFAQIPPANQWQALENGSDAEEVKRLRQMIDRYRSGDSLPTTLSEIWYDIASRRIDEMQSIELKIEKNLLHLCDTKIHTAKNSPQQSDNSDQIPEPPMSVLSSLEHIDKGTASDSCTVMPGINTRLAQSVSGLLQQQAFQMQHINDELAQARQALDERKQVDKAKGILMNTRHLTEDEAYKYLRRSAMDNNQRIIDVANNVIRFAEMLLTPDN